MASSPPSPQEAGLGHSTPLVTIPHGHGSGSGIRTAQQRFAAEVAAAAAATTTTSTTTTSATTTVTDNHPLAFTAEETMDVELSDRSSSAAVYANVAVTPWTTTSTNTLPTLALPTPPTTTILSTAPSPANKSLEALTDNFLAGPSARIDQGQKPLLSPPPFFPLQQQQQQPSDLLEHLRALVERRAWNDVSQVATQLLQSASSPYTLLYTALLHTDNSNNNNNNSGLSLDTHCDDLVEILTIQCHAWMQRKQYVHLGLELDRWGFLHHHNNGNTINNCPVWIPWSLHTLAAAALEYTAAPDAPVQAVDALCAIRASLVLLQQQQQQDNGGAALAFHTELSQVEHALSNTLVRQKKWRSALQSLERMLDFVPAQCEAQVQVQANNRKTRAAATVAETAAETVTVLQAAYRCEILSRQGRILLQVGAVQEAGQVFEQAKVLWNDQNAVHVNLVPQAWPGYDAVQIVPAQLHSNEGLYSFACGKYNEASEFFRKGVEAIKAVGAMTCAYRTSDWVGPGVAVGTEFRHALYSETVNNIALCAIYTCRLHEAVYLMECLVRENPAAFLTERVAYNLCTLYELGYDTAASARKKRVLQIVAKRFFLHDIGPESFRIS
jgi:tetratricopeptide (TPR) repeat protein